MRRWSEIEVEKMLDYRDEGLTEAKIAVKMSIIFMRRFTEESVNRKIRDLKRSGYIDANNHTGRWDSPSGKKRRGEKTTETTVFQKPEVKPKKKKVVP